MHDRERTWRGAVILFLACSFGFTACGSVDPPREKAEAIAQPILGADGGPDGSGLAFVAHTQGVDVCSGVLIAPTLILTAKHCVFLSSPSGDTPLPTGGFQIGFGPSRDLLVERSVDMVQWIGMPAGLSVASAVAAGEDVAVLHLTQPAPSQETVRDVSLTFTPANVQPVRVGGYGITDLATGASGTRGIAFGPIAGFDPSTGIIEVSGAPVCFGDSGGPVLSADGSLVLGVLGQVGRTDGSFCDAALSFADTAANTNVQRLLAKACAAVGGCGPIGGLIGDAGSEAATADPDASVPIDGASDAIIPAEIPPAIDAASTPHREDTITPSSSGCTCTGACVASSQGYTSVLVLMLLLVPMRRWHRSRNGIATIGPMDYDAPQEARSCRRRLVPTVPKAHDGDDEGSCSGIGNGMMTIPKDHGHAPQGAWS